MSLTITLFGSMRVEVDGQPLPHLQNRKGLWLLALLVLRHGRPVEREWLAGMLWPDKEHGRSLGKTLPALAQSVALLRGPLLEGCAEEWAPRSGVSERKTACRRFRHWRKPRWRRAFTRWRQITGGGLRPSIRGGRNRGAG